MSNNKKRGVTHVRTPAAAFMNGGFNSHALMMDIANGWKDAVTPKVQPKSYEARGRCSTMTAAKLAVAEAKRQTPLRLHAQFQAIVEEFDGGYDWDWKRKEPETVAIGGWMR